MTILLVIIALAVLILIHEFGHFAAAKLFGVRVDEFGFGFPPRIYSREGGETRYSVNLLPFGGFVRIFGEDVPPPEGHPDASRAFLAKPIGARALIIGGGILMNFLAGWLLLSAVFMVGAVPHAGISEVAPGSPAEAAGLLPGDLILSATAGETELRDPVPIDALVALAREASMANIPLALEVRRGGGEETVVLTGRVAPPEGEGALGVVLFDTGIPQAGFFASFIRGAEAFGSLVRLIVVGLYNFFAGLFAGEGQFANVAGPVGIVSIAVASVSFGVAPFLNLMALISVHLALLNFLPLPALDGGRLVFLALEALRGAPVSRRIERATHAIGFLLLVLLMVVITARDIGRLIP